MSNFAIVNNVFRHDLRKQYIEEFTDNHLLVLIYMQKFKTYSGEMNFCIGWLFDDLEISYYQTQKDLISCLQDLINWNLIVLINDVVKINKNTRLQVILPVYEARFTKILFTEIDKILKLDIDIRIKKTMLFLYCDIASWIDLKGYCYTSFEYFRRDINTTSDNRINDALQTLNQHMLIDYKNVGQIISEGSVEQGNNVYVLCCNEDYKEKLSRGVENRTRKYREKKVKIYEGRKSNYQRSLKQKLNYLWIKYNEENITDEELEELKKKEEEYYSFRKLDDDVDEIPFVLFDPNAEDENEELLG